MQRTSATPAVFNGLVERGVFEVYQQEIGRLNAASARTTLPLNPLNGHQQRAYDSIVESFRTKCLFAAWSHVQRKDGDLHPSDRKVIRQGKQVLYLLPEIALTTQITERLQRVFGLRLGIYHSKFPDAERVEIWQKQLSDSGYDII